MNACLLAAALIIPNVVGQTMYEGEIEAQNVIFQKLWGTEINWTFDELPAAARVADDRVPYSGYIYPDTHGGTVSALRKYDQAFDQGTLATAFERRDTSLTAPVTRRVSYTRRVGFGGSRTFTRLETVRAVPYWYGHCNGWTSATIRHAEPQQSVERNGVVFTPSDIKGLLAEMYIYNENEMLAEGYINPGKLHAVIANWVGRGMHPIGMEADPGSEKWNYPIYGYSMEAYNRSPGHVDVRLTVTYAMSSETEADKSPRIAKEKHFNYHLNLDGDGKIVGGYYYRNSARIDMLWVPLRPKAAGEKGNERGNPHIDVEKVLAIWRDSVPAEQRAGWAHVDPFLQDRLADDIQFAHLRPAQPAKVVLASADVANDANDAVATTELAAEESVLNNLAMP
ncbi:MAG TPA: hypothetical protein P5307_20765, partial [Pirellulaceae bacterium]|nr:hypothetical protein [Pirellulaceae bacterium]